MLYLLSLARAPSCVIILVDSVFLFLFLHRRCYSSDVNDKLFFILSAWPEHRNYTYCHFANHLASVNIPQSTTYQTQVFIGLSETAEVTVRPSPHRGAWTTVRLYFHSIERQPGKKVYFFLRLKLYDPVSRLSSQRFSRRFRGYLVFGERHKCRVGEIGTR